MLPIVVRSFPPPPGFSLKMFEGVRIGPNLRTLEARCGGRRGQGPVGSDGRPRPGAAHRLRQCGQLASGPGGRTRAGTLHPRRAGRQPGPHCRGIVSRQSDSGAARKLAGSGAGLWSVAGHWWHWRRRVCLARAKSALTGQLCCSRWHYRSSRACFSVPSPYLKYAGAHLGTGLREGGRSLSESRQRHRSRSVLVVVQVALALVLLISSGLMIRTFRALTGVDPGFVAPAQLQTFRLDIPDTQVKDPERVVRMEEEILHKIEALPGVSSVGLSMSIPMDGNEWTDVVFAKDRAYSPGDLPLHRFRFVAPGFFKTLGTPLSPVGISPGVTSTRSFRWPSSPKTGARILARSRPRPRQTNPGQPEGRLARDCRGGR